MVRALRFNHVAVHADDLEESARFYEELFGMTRLPTASFQEPVLWLALGDQQLHLFQRSDAMPPYLHHFALDVDDFDAMYEQAKRRALLDGEAFHQPVRMHPAGWVQMYLRDPAGNLVEVVWPDVTTLDAATQAEIGRLADEVPQRGAALTASPYTKAPAG
jgi:catechol 2,3-dioxygenase-like lactoylglutathione lyase family enzyme